jgi:hypothetical protein
MMIFPVIHRFAGAEYASLPRILLQVWLLIGIVLSEPRDREKPVNLDELEED